MAGYLRNAEATSEALRARAQHTGDLGYIRDGEVFWVGRERERITLCGLKLDPSEFEAILLGEPALRAGCFVAFGVDDPSIGTQRLVLICEVREPLGKPATDIVTSITELVYAALGVRPDDLVLVHPGTLTKTSSGKRRHRFFRELYLAGGLEMFRVGKSAA